MAKQWFFGDGETPTNGDAAGLVTVGQRFVSDVDGHLTRIRIRGSATATTIGPLWRVYESDTHTLLASGSFGTIVPGAWNTATLPTPLAVSAGREFVVAIYTDRYVATPGYHAAAITRGHLTAPIGAGIFIEGNDSFPSEPPFNNTSYLVDAEVDDTPDYTPPVITSPGSKTGQVGTAITPITMSVSGGTGGPYTWTATGLPPGLAIRSADGMITGTPTVAGTYTVTLHASDGVAEGTATFAFTVAAPLAPSDTSQALAAVGLDLLRADPRLHVHPGLVPSGATLPYVVVWSSISRAPDDDQDDAARQRMVRWSCHSVGANADAATMVAGWVADAMLTGEKPVVAGFDCGPVYEDQGPVPLPPNETLGTAVYDVSVVYAMTATS